ncbi:MAG: (Fe-S)-binding protein, partial [Gammaproteobacteria bacterium]|nr:(Fe-S)-binding protein [Gammaproteobacteria bacterium]
GRRLGVSRLVSYRPSLEPYRGWLDYYPAQGLEKGRVSLFLGCVARAIDRPVMEAAIRILTRLGYGVKIPPDQGCCGALYAHDGEARDALRLAGRNLDAFSADPVLTTASGCAAQLLEYPFLEGITAERRNQALAFASRISDISRFLADREWPDGLDIRPLPARVVVHEPCSLRNVMRQQSGPYELLARIPGLEVVPLAENPACCGAAGTHMFEHGSMADGLGDEMCDAVAGTGAEMLVTSNVGCALHLSSRLRKRGSRVRVMHPVVLLAGQVKWDS